MVKKTIFLIIILLLVGGGFFYWWQGHADERALNKTLPEGVRVDKCLLTGEYRVVNKIDGYEFKVPKEWRGVKEIEYTPEQEEENRVASSVYLEGKEGAGNIISIDAYVANQLDINLEEWAKALFNDYGLSGEFRQEKIGDYDAPNVREEEHLAGAHIYFLHHNSKIYVFTGRSEEFIKEIILNGKW